MALAGPGSPRTRLISLFVEHFLLVLPMPKEVGFLEESKEKGERREGKHICLS